MLKYQIIWLFPIENDDTTSGSLPPYLEGTTPSRCWSSWVSSRTSSGARPVCWRSCLGRSCLLTPSPVAAAVAFPWWPSPGTALQGPANVHSPSIHGCSAAFQPTMKVNCKLKQSLISVSMLDCYVHRWSKFRIKKSPFKGSLFDRQYRRPLRRGWLVNVSPAAWPRSSLNWMLAAGLQLSVVRSILFFVTLVLWTDEQYDYADVRRRTCLDTVFKSCRVNLVQRVKKSLTWIGQNEMWCITIDCEHISKTTDH